MRRTAYDIVSRTAAQGFRLGTRRRLRRTSSSAWARLPDASYRSCVWRSGCGCGTTLSSANRRSTSGSTSEDGARAMSSMSGAAPVIRAERGFEREDLPAPFLVAVASVARSAHELHAHVAFVDR